MTALEVELPCGATVFAWGTEKQCIQAAFSGCKIRPFSLSEEEREALADMGGEVAAGRLSADAALWSVVKSRCDFAVFVSWDCGFSKTFSLAPPSSDIDMDTKGKPPVVAIDTFKPPSGSICTVGDAGWHRWLETDGARSFRFEGKSGTFTARKEFPAKGRPYWVANRRVNGRLRKAYLGGSERLDLDCLELAAARLASPGYRSRAKSKTSSEGGSGDASYLSPPDFKRLQTQLAELQSFVQHLGGKPVDFNQYQIQSRRTVRETCLLTPRQQRLLGHCLGLAGESGEVMDLIKKHTHHGHGLDKNKLQEELGDVLWYLAQIAAELNIDLSEVARENLAKLESRYPNGFSEEASRQRQPASSFQQPSKNTVTKESGK